MRVLAPILLQMPHEQADVLPLRRIEAFPVSAGEVMVEMNEVVPVSLKRFFLADSGMVDFDRLRDQLLVGQAHA
jgi:hypothetical protein